MTALCLKKLMGQALRTDANFLTRCFATLGAQPMRTTMISHTWVDLEQSKRGFLSVLTKTFCTYKDAEEKVKGKKNANARKTIDTVGRKIPHRIIRLIDENGEDQGQVHRADVIRIMDEKELKLVVLKESADPPVYRLMSGQQIHEERLKLRDKQKASTKKAGPVQQKELTFTTAIAQHDLDVKVKQIQQWIEKKHHVRVTVQEKKIADGPEKMLKLFERILETMSDKATYLSPPRVLNENRSMCVYRHMSEKELHEYKRMEKEKSTQKDNEKEPTESCLQEQ
uniref:translation initiation factor IF-3, mitochondrial n=1 Tax=Euleptes europaea TaxID=460621 RepID=UPI00253FCBBB|nr:translation initiation factor IF-3, mitochondrial [Euleptes europaea]